MVIAYSDSTGTLVSLDDDAKGVFLLDPVFDGYEPERYQKTDLWISTSFSPRVETEDSFDGLRISSTDEHNNIRLLQKTFMESSSMLEPLYLPVTKAVDQYLRDIPSIVQRCDSLCSQPPMHYTRSAKERIIYVAQGEVAHSTQKQCDVLVSDKATTCHIVALYSTSQPSGEVMASLTHVDAPQYEDSIRKMIQVHRDYHVSSRGVQLDVHVMGGFDDDARSSRELSNWLLHLLARIAAEDTASCGFQSLSWRLQTCMVSSLNQCPMTSGPRGRGLCLDLRTGAVALAQCDRSVAGPCNTVRSLRLWSSMASSPRLHCIHHFTSDVIHIEPFMYQPFPDLARLLALPDHLLLQLTSTSPDFEEDDFCELTRACLQFLRDVPCRNVFPHRRPLHYRRGAHHVNEWIVEK